MSASRPFTDAHAIARLDFALIFSDHLADDVRAEIERTLRELLPDDFEAIHDDDDGDRAYALERKGEDGDVTEAVHVHAHYVHVVWFDYRGWSFSRDTAIARLQPVLEIVRSGRLKLSAAGLAYKDVFFNDNPDDYRADEVLRRDSRYLPPIAFDFRGKWRHSLRWSETMSDAGFKSYSTLDLDAGLMRPEEEDDPEVHITEIAHRQQIVGNQAKEGVVEWSDENLSGAWDFAHEVNRLLIVGLLTDEMLQRVGLMEGLK